MSIARRTPRDFVDSRLRCPQFQGGRTIEAGFISEFGEVVNACCGGACFDDFGIFAGPRTGFCSAVHHRLRPTACRAAALAGAGRRPKPSRPCQRPRPDVTGAAAGPCRSSRPSREIGGEMRQPECARRFPYGRDRHHRRSGLRLRAFQAARLPARPRGRADLRRRSVADHPGGAQGACRRMRQGDLLPDRQTRHLLPGNPPSGRRRRSHHRLAHLVARRPFAQQDAGRRQGRNREGHQRGEVGA